MFNPKPKKKKFTLTREVAGYSRGYQTVTVEADSLQEAKQLASSVATSADIEIVRDDRDRGDWSE